MYEPNRTEIPPKTFVQFRLSRFEYSAMEKIARFLNSKGLIPKPTVSSLTTHKPTYTVTDPEEYIGPNIDWLPNGDDGRTNVQGFLTS